MGKDDLLILEAPPRRGASSVPPAGLKRRRPRAYAEWKALRRWGKLPAWEAVFPGYLLREARERAGLTQEQMAERLGCTQQAVARAERPDSNPTVAFLEAWGEALGMDLELEFGTNAG
jgi:DNA-binding XRE family transcriptional regulator